MSDIKIFVTWKTLELIVTVEDADYYAPDEWIPTCGYLELDVHDWTPALRQIQAQFDDEPDRYFDRVVEDCSDKVYEDGLVAYAEQQAGLAERYAEEKADWLYHQAKESRRSFRRSF